MKKLLCTVRLILIAVALYAQQPPGTEIYLADVAIKKMKVSVSNLQNITNRAGYDNQPYFHPVKPLVYYASANAEGKTDIVEYNYSTNQTRSITSTSEQEYSPTVTPDLQFLSCIIQRDNGAQDLAKYPIDGGEPQVILNSLTIGYHAWINAQELLLFVLGDTFTLHRYNLSSMQDKIVASGIGRSLHTIPKSSAMSFVHKLSEREWIIKKLNGNGSIETITHTLRGSEDLTWTPDGKILMSDGKHLFYYWPGKIGYWVQIPLPGLPAGTITRLAVNAQGNKLALVISE